MRVLIIPSFYPTKDEPNRGIFFQQQAQLCVREDVEIHVLYYELRSLKKIKSFVNWRNHFQVKASKEGDLLVYRCHAWNIIPTQYQLGKKLWVNHSYKLFKKYIKLYGLPDVIHVQSAFQAGNLAYKIKQEYGIPYMINEHSTSVKLSHFSDLEIDNYKTIFDNAYCTVAVSESFKNLISKRFLVSASQIRVIPNFINTGFFCPDADHASSKSLTFLVVCFLEKKKRVDRLIDAFNEAFKHDETVKLMIGGEGPERVTITEKINHYNLQDRVSLLGALSQTQVRDKMRQCTCFILPSEVETFGVVLIEAMAVGKPVIATRSGGPEDFVNNDVGIIAENEVNSITTALIEMKNNLSKYNSDVIRTYILNNFSSQVVSNKVIELYKEIKKAAIICK